MVIQRVLGTDERGETAMNSKRSGDQQRPEVGPPEQQLQAWMRTVLDHAALRWQSTQRRQRILLHISEEEEGRAPWTLADYTQDAVREWFVDCLDHLTPRDQVILQSLWAGYTQTEVARIVQCDSRTIRRRLHHIRQQCPY